MRLPFALSIFCFIGLSLLATEAKALNLLVNGDFATGLGGWTLFDIVPSQAYYYWTPPNATPAKPGGTTGGSLNLTGQFTGVPTVSQCVPITGNAIRASVLIYPYVTTGLSIAQFAAFNSGDCSGSALEIASLEPAAPIVANAWTTYQSSDVILPQASKSIRFDLGAAGGANNSEGDYLFDDARLDMLTIFGDGFDTLPGEP